MFHSVAYRVLGDSDRADIAVENCLLAAFRDVRAFECEGAFRSWLVRSAIDEALAIDLFPGMARLAAAQG